MNTLRDFYHFMSDARARRWTQLDIMSALLVALLIAGYTYAVILSIYYP